MVFNPKDKEHKKQLYKVLRALADLNSAETVETLFDKGVGQPVARGIDYMNNVRKGDFNSTYAALIHSWLLTNHFPTAHKFAPKIFPETPEMRWRGILDHRARAGQLKILPVETEKGIVQRGSVVDSADVVLKLGQNFRLELTSEHCGFAIALQGLRNQWHEFPLVGEDVYAAQVKPGQNLFPLTSRGAPDTLVEHHDLGFHEFVAIESVEQDIPLSIDRLVTWVNTTASMIHRVSVRFL